MAVYKRTDTRSQGWYYKFVIDGKTFKKGIPTARTKRQAEDAEREARQEVHEGRYRSQRTDMRFTEFVEKVYLVWAVQNLRASTCKTIRVDSFCKHFKSYSIRQMSVMAIEGYKQSRAKALTQYDKPFMASTINLELDGLSGILSYAVTLKYSRENPCIQVARLETPEGTCRYLLPEEETRLMVELEREPAFMKPLVRLVLLTGLRRGELLALTKDSVDLPRNRLYVSNPKWRKDPRKTKGTPINREAREILSHLVAGADGNHLFTNEAGKPVTPGMVANHFRRARIRAGLADVKFHSLRHTFGTRLGEANVSIEKIARLMGHANISMTVKYVHSSDESLTNAVEHAIVQESTRFVPAKLSEVLAEKRKALRATG